MPASHRISIGELVWCNSYLMGGQMESMPLLFAAYLILRASDL